jgi:hypothetical protein
MQFLFASALWALPLVGLPVLLHLLFRRKSPVLLFSTVRFIKASVQQTAARKRVHRWLLLACRALLLLLLVLVAAQPAKILASGLTTSGRSVVAAIVVDTSYSMLMKQGSQTRLDAADAVAQELLRTRLKGAKAALMTSRPPGPDAPDQLQPAEQLLAQWSPLRPQGTTTPLSDRVTAAMDLLGRQPADEKWLFVLSDFQKKEFPRPLPAFADGHLVLIDLHAPAATSAGVTRVAVDPPQPTPGIGSDLVVDVIGPPGTSRALNVSVLDPGGNPLLQMPMQMANLDDGGHGRLRVPVRLPAARWMLLRATLPDDDDMPWDNTRDELIEAPPRQIVTLLPNPREEEATHVVRLALDPLGGQSDAWPLAVKEADQIQPGSNVAVMLLDAWPNAARATRLSAFVRSGGTLIWFLRPGVEQSWVSLPANDQTALEKLLPSVPLAAQTTDETPGTVAFASAQDPVLRGLEDKRFNIDAVSVLRLVPLAETDAITPLINAFPVNPGPGVHPHGLLYRKSLAGGTVFTFTTLPDQQFTNLAAHPLFLPLLVHMSLPGVTPADAANVDIGQPLTLSGTAVEGVAQLRLVDPQGGVNAVFPTKAADGAGSFIFPATTLPGIYRWQKVNESQPLALANVQLPASESDSHYAAPDDVATGGDNVISVHSLDDLNSRFAGTGQPQPRWTPAVAALLMLLCVEAFLGSGTTPWKRQAAMG